MSFFHQLSTGIKFDKNKYRQEAEKFGLVKKDTKTENPIENLPLDDDFVPDSNLPTPDESDEENNELRILGKNSF